MLEEVKILKSQVASRLIKRKRRRRKLYYTTAKERSRAKMRGDTFLSRGKHSYGETSKALDFGDQEVADIVGDGISCLDKIIEEPLPIVEGGEDNRDGEEDNQSNDKSEDESDADSEEPAKSRQDSVSISYYLII